MTRMDRPTLGLIARSLLPAFLRSVAPGEPQAIALSNERLLGPVLAHLAAPLPHTER